VHTHTRQHGFSLIELMIVVAIIGVLAAAGLAAYTNNLHRAQLAEATGLLWSAKSPMAEYYAGAARWPAQPGDVMGTISGKYTASISYYGTPDNAPPGRMTLMATLNTLGVAPEIRGTTLVLETADGGANWRCRSGGANPIADIFLPGACLE